MRETMGPAARAAESEVPLQERANGDGHLETVGEPEPPRNCRKRYYKNCRIVRTVALAVVSLCLIAVVLAVLTPKLPSADLCPPACPDGWIGYRGKCFYFSETEGNWTYSQSQCSTLNASLAGIDSEQDMMFLLRYKGVRDHWIGLWREQGQPWKWTNGTKFNHLFRIRGGGDCAYLNDKNWVNSSQCYIERWWICSKPEVYMMKKRTALEGSSK